MELFLIVAFAVIAWIYVLRPFWSPEAGRESWDPALSADRLADLQKRKDEALAAIKEAEFDWNMNKLTREDYEAIRTKYAQIALATMDEIKRLDQAQMAKPTRSISRYDCPRCGAEQSLTASFCFACGQKLPRQGGSRPVLRGEHTSAG